MMISKHSITSGAISSNPDSCRFFSSLRSSLISGSTSSSGARPVNGASVVVMAGSSQQLRTA